MAENSIKPKLDGGYRLQGHHSMIKPSLPVVSIITVVYNDVAHLERTILSILNQIYPNIEYIIIDGGSNDGTVAIIQKYEDRIARWVSEPDKGLYDAMNKGLEAAMGEFVWFMNSGDRIYRDDTLEKIMSIPRQGDAETHICVYYGDTMIVDKKNNEIGLRRLRPPKKLTWRSFRKGMTVCHQAILIRRDLTGPFDPRYRHSADFDWVIKALKKARGQEGRKAEGNINTGLILCAFLDGGHSKQNISLSLSERFNSMVTHYGLLTTLFWHLIIPFRFWIYFFKNRRF